MTNSIIIPKKKKKKDNFEERHDNKLRCLSYMQKKMSQIVN